MRYYKQLTHEQRYSIYVLRQAEMSGRDIATMINVHHSTVYRELKRNTRIGYKVYRHGSAQRLAQRRRRRARRPTVLTPEVKMLITDKLKKHWSPEQISGRLKLCDELSISHQAIYTYIRHNRANGGKLYKYLRRRKRYRKRYAKSPGIVNRVFIDKRPAAANLRIRIGDWEVDTIVSRKHKDVIISVVDRYSKFTLIGMAKNKSARNVSRKMIALLSRKQDKVVTITSDNGTEFAMHKRVSKWLSADYYFCHPYSSWERGLNENTNGLIRQYVPKGEPFNHLDRDRLKQIANNLNHRPRKTLGFKTPYEVFHEL